MPRNRLGRLVAAIALVIGMGATTGAALSSPGPATPGGASAADAPRAGHASQPLVNGAATPSETPEKDWWSSAESRRAAGTESAGPTNDPTHARIPEKAAPGRAAGRAAHARQPLAARGARPGMLLRPLRVRATAYAIHGRTSTGTRTTHGTIAVDPRVIPYGTRMYIPGYGWGTAQDCGGAVQGHVIDLWMPTTSQCYQWGNRHVDIYVEHPEHPPLLASRSGRRLPARRHAPSPSTPRPATKPAKR